MATKRWRGDAQAVAQRSTITAGGTWANGDTATMAINGKDVTVTFGNGVPTTVQVAAALKAAWEGEAITAYGETRNTTGNLIPEFSRVTATVVSSVVTLTADDAGVPFTETSTETSASGTLTDATPTAATGPNHYDNAENWDPVNVPVDADDIVFENSAVDVLYGLSQTTVTPGTVRVASTYTGKIGLPDRNDAGAYYEYRLKYLTCDGCTSGVTLEDGDGVGSGRIKLDFGTGVAFTVNVNKTGTPTETGVPSLLIKGGLAGCVLNLTRGNVGVARDAGSVAVIPTIRVGSQGGTLGDVRLELGPGVTLTTITQAGGNVTVRSNVTTVNLTSGTFTQLSGTLGTLNQDGGTTFYQSTGTVTTAVVRGQGTAIDFSRDIRPRTVTNLTVQGGAALIDPHETVTFSNPFVTDRASLRASDLGTAFNLQRS